MKPVNILHIAVQNFAGVPSTFVKFENMLGFNSTLVTFVPHPHGFNDGICLNFPFISKGGGKKFASRSKGYPPNCKDKEFPYSLLFTLRDNIFYGIARKKGFLELLNKADIVVLDGGLGVLRSGKLIASWAETHRKLTSVFYGSDLRVRGVIPRLDELSNLHFTLEYDHLALHPKVKYLRYPFDFARVPLKHRKISNKFRVGHSPTKRITKGTDIILKKMRELEQERDDIEFVLIENKPYIYSLYLQSTCDIFIDQLGDLGYGQSALQSLYLGIPTLVELTDEYAAFLGKHPFIRVSPKNLKERICELADSPTRRKELSEKGKMWVIDFHNPYKTVETVLDNYRRLSWL